MKYLDQMSRRVPFLSDKSEWETARVNVADQDACSWVVTLSPWRYSVRGVGAQPPDAARSLPTALVEWGHGQIPLGARLDWPGSGATFVVHGTFVKVVLQNEPSGNLPGTAIAPVFTGGATIVPGSNRDRSVQPILTGFVAALLPGGTVSVVIPPFARGLRWYYSGAGAGPAALPLLFDLVWRSDVTAAIIYGHQRHNTSPDQWVSAVGVVNAGWSGQGYIPVPTGAGRLDIVNRDAAINLDLNLQWIIDVG